MPGQAPIADQLAALLLQRPPGRRQAEPDRPRLRDGAGAEDAAGPDRGRTDPARAATATTSRSRCRRSPAGYGVADPRRGDASDTTWKRGGKKVGYINAHCAGGRLQVHGTLSFTRRRLLPGDPDLAMPLRRLKAVRSPGLALIAALLSRRRRRGALVEVNDLVLHADGGFQPRSLPRAPVRADRLPGPLRHRRQRRRQAGRRCEQAVIDFDRDGRLSVGGPADLLAGTGRRTRAPPKRGGPAAARSSAPATSKR